MKGNLQTKEDARKTEKYEKNQTFNKITSYLHTFRHEILLEYFIRLASEIDGRPVRVLEIGCGTGKAFEKLNARHPIEYIGVDAGGDYIRTAVARYGNAGNAAFIEADAADPAFYAPGSADLVFALETFEHIPERDVVRIVENVCRVVRPRLFIASVPVEIGPAVWIKTLGSRMMGYRRTPYTASEAWNAGLYKLNRLPPHGTSHKGFNWYWLEQTIRHNAPLRETRSLPFRWLPKPLAPTVMFVTEPKQVEQGRRRVATSLPTSPVAP